MQFVVPLHHGGLCIVLDCLAVDGSVCVSDVQPEPILLVREVLLRLDVAPLVKESLQSGALGRSEAAHDVPDTDTGRFVGSESWRRSILCNIVTASASFAGVVDFLIQKWINWSSPKMKKHAPSPIKRTDACFQQSYPQFEKIFIDECLNWWYIIHNKQKAHRLGNRQAFLKTVNSAKVLETLRGDLEPNAQVRSAFRAINDLYRYYNIYYNKLSRLYCTKNVENP